MHIHSAAECPCEMLIPTEMGHDSELNLGVVGREDESVIVLWNECLPDFLATLCPDWDVLKVRV